ncbi:MAG: DUF3362 domain-containing protein, partial [Lachnospiraceae bacterium]|nr:DUF3362 domain-containing protein [Lachnospiraceae bacterium]
SHPGSTMKDAIALAEYLHKNHLNPEQVQDFYPTPGTVSTCMYYTGIDPRTMTEVFVERNPHRKAMQRALIQYNKPENYELVKEALLAEHREDLIGYGPEYLIPPRKENEEIRERIRERKKKEKSADAGQRAAGAGTKKRKNQRKRGN